MGLGSGQRIILSRKIQSTYKSLPCTKYPAESIQIQRPSILAITMFSGSIVTLELQKHP